VITLKRVQVYIAASDVTHHGCVDELLDLRLRVISDSDINGVVNVVINCGVEI
jgi:hypothetical protein